jgi:hypothetical protein
VALHAETGQGIPCATIQLNNAAKFVSDHELFGPSGLVTVLEPGLHESGPFPAKWVEVQALVYQDKLTFKSHDDEDHRSSRASGVAAPGVPECLPPALHVWPDAPWRRDRGGAAAEADPG